MIEPNISFSFERDYKKVGHHHAGRVEQKARFCARISGEPNIQSTLNILERLDHTFSYKMVKISSKYRI